MKRQLFTALMTAGAVLLLVSGCGKNKQAAAPAVESMVSEAPSMEAKIGLSLPDEQDIRWKKDGDALIEKFRERGVEVVCAYAGNDSAKQNSDISSMVSTGCQLLIVAPVEDYHPDSSLQSAKDAGIPIISYDDLIPDTGALTAYVSFNDSEAGMLEAKYIAGKLGLKETENSKEYGIEFAACKVADEPVGYVFNGAFNVMKPYFDTDGLRAISGENTLFDSLTEVVPEAVPADSPDPKAAAAKALSDAKENAKATAKKRLQTIASEYYDGEFELSAVLCADPLSAKAAAEAVGSGGKKHDAIITSAGTDEEILELLVDKQIDMTVFEPTDKLMDVTCSLTMSLLSGETPDATLIERSGWSFNCVYDTESYDNGAGLVVSYLVSPVSVTSNTIDAELVKTGYYTMDGKYPKRS